MKTFFLHTIHFFISFLFLISFTIHAQSLKKFNGRTYTVTEGLLNKPILDMTEDGNGFLWISTGEGGLQRFDGTIFETIYPQPGLPQTNHISFFKLSNGNIWLRYENGISAYNCFTNKFQLIYTNTKKIEGPSRTYSLVPPFVPFIEIMNEVWCWGEAEKKFISVNKSSGKIINSVPLPDSLQPTSYSYKKANDNTVYFDAANGNIVQIDFIKKGVKHIFRPNENYLIKNYAILNYAPLGNDQLLLITSKAIYKANIATGVTTLFCLYPRSVLNSMLYLSLTYLQGHLYALSINNELFILEALSGQPLYRMVDNQNKPFISDGIINKLFTDRHNNIWVISDKKELTKINFNIINIKFYGNDSLQNNFTKCIYPDKKYNLIITGTLFNGLNIFDTSQHLIKHFNLNFREQASCILKVQPYKYLLFTDGDPGIYLFNAKKLQLTPLNKKYFIPHEVSSFTYVQQLTDTTAALFCKFSLYIINYSAGDIKFTRIAIPQNYSAAIIDYKQRLWLAEPNKYSILSGKNFEHKSFFYLPEKIATNYFFEDNEKNIWIGTERGLCKLKGNTMELIKIYTHKDGLESDSIYSIINDDNGNLWCGTNKGISCIYRDGKIINLYTQHGLQSDQFNTNSCARAADGELFFGGINGVNSFYAENIGPPAEPKLLMTNIKIMNQNINTESAPWNLQHITLAYTENVFAFYFTVLGSRDPTLYNYKYKMTGIDKEWIDADNHGFARYVLPPGKYIFEYTAIGNQLQKSLAKYISITISPPFWQTIWFFILLVVCAIASAIVIVNFYNKRRQQKQLRLIEIQQTVQKERERISRDLHDNIGAYTTVLIASAEQLNSKATEPYVQQSAQVVKENAQHILGSLQEAIWVLNNDAITITDFADRLKVYGKKIIKNFPDVHVNFKEQIEKDIALSPEEALNLFRIMQEAMQNSLKHSQPQHINVTIDSNEHICLSLQDDGKGFDINNASTGHGLYNMHHRAKEAGYELYIISSEQGTKIELIKKNTSFKKYS